jgi:4-hydroxy-3-methylbut-2-en-1-yl diphosphate synthase IspG/GcpE
MVGLVVAVIGLGATIWVNGRISTIRADAEATVAQAGATLELTATVLRGASTTAQSFSGTAEQTRQAVSAAVATISEARSDLSALEAQLRSVSVLGATPLASSADAVARITASMDGLESQVPLVADGLQGNRDALARDAAALSRLADSTAALAASLGSGAGQDSIGAVQQVIAITLLVFAAWSCVPAIGALGLGAWLWAELARSHST